MAIVGFLVVVLRTSGGSEGHVAHVARIGCVHARSHLRVGEVEAVLANHVALAVGFRGEGDGAFGAFERLLTCESNN